MLIQRVSPTPGIKNQETLKKNIVSFFALVLSRILGLMIKNYSLFFLRAFVENENLCDFLKGKNYSLIKEKNSL